LLRLPYRDLLATRGAEGFRAAQLMLPAESAHDTVAALGEVGLLQFKDLNPDKSAFQRTFANRVRASALPANSPHSTLFYLVCARSVISELARKGLPTKVWRCR